MIVLKCSGCRRPMGVTTSPNHPAVFCTAQCAEDHPVSDDEARDALIEALVEHGVGQEVIGDVFGIRRQRVGQIAKARSQR